MSSLLTVVLFCASKLVWAQLPVVTFAQDAGFPLINEGAPAAVWVDPSAPPGLKSVAEWFADDLERVSGERPVVSSSTTSFAADSCVMVGVLGTGGLVDQLIEAGKLDASAIAGKWEASLIQVIDKPFPAVKQALVVAGADKRGAIYGLLNLSRAAGVSPWYWWADVPTAQRTDVCVTANPYVRKEPRVQYRGIFLNDEAPALANWAQEKFGGCNSKFYAHVFELILRLRGNFLWPAMWGRSLFDDDPESQRLADELGVVLSTSHHEPMMRAHVEWQRYGHGPWDYSRNSETLRTFWREGIRRMGTCESVVTLAMRGDGDKPMSEGANIALLEKIVSDQRQILAEELPREVTEQPQVWALYKEVQEYYDRGMRVPDDVILLLCDDNWGNVRRLPSPTLVKHPGGYGMYYHFDYVGDPRNYKWINTNSLPRVWEQMHLAWEHDVDKIWVVNVGDLKPMEQPIDLFLSLAWNPDAFPAETIGTQLAAWQAAWAAEQFGEEHAPAIAALLADYGNCISRRKPELLDADTYSLTNFREWERVVAQWHDLSVRAEQVEHQLGAEFQDAYYQLVLHPILAAANLHDLYCTVARNRHYASQHRSATNALADKAAEYFARDAALTKRYHELHSGKWNHMMSQTHIGYTSWQEPREQVMPRLERIDQLPESPAAGIELEGDSDSALPDFIPGGPFHWIEVYNKGTGSLSYSIGTSDPWIRLSSQEGEITDQQRIEVSVDWSEFPSGSEPREGRLTVETSAGDEWEVKVVAQSVGEDARGFVAANGWIAIDASHYSRARDSTQVRWYALPRLGRTEAAMIAAPTTAAPTLPGPDGVCLEYPIHLNADGEVTVEAYLAPTLDFLGGSLAPEGHGIRFGISLDDEEPCIIDMHADRSTPEANANPWRARVSNNLHIATSPKIAATAGNHTLKFWRIDPGIVLEKLVVKAKPVPRSHLGPPESPTLPRSDDPRD